jgi:hypothetical protein
MTSSVGFQYLDTKICKVNGGGYIGVVHLLHLQSGDKTCFESNVIQDRSEAVFTSMDRAIRHLCQTFGLRVIDPNFTVVRELEEVEKALKKEMEKLANGTGALETWPHEAILEIHSLADWFDGDEYIHRLLVAMCFDLSRHLDIVPQLIKDVERKDNFLFYYHSIRGMVLIFPIIQFPMYRFALF